MPVKPPTTPTLAAAGGRRRLPIVYNPAQLPQLATPQRGASHKGDIATFLGAITRSPHQLGAIAPSSRALAALAATAVPTSGAPTVVELGPGAGVITDAIAERLPDGGRQVAVELNGDMVRHLSRSRPWLELLAGDAVDLVELLAGAQITHADAIISALPWTLLPADVQTRILDQVRTVLAPDRQFVTITTLSAWPFPSCRAFRRRVHDVFAAVNVLGPIWRNVPPAVVLACRNLADG